MLPGRLTADLIRPIRNASHFRPGRGSAGGEGGEADGGAAEIGICFICTRFGEALAARDEFHIIRLP